MSFQDAVLLAVSAVRGNKLKTLLTILGLAVGVGTVLSVLALGDAGEIRVEAEIAKMGVDKVWVRAADSRHVLHQEDSELLYAATQAPACAGAYTADVLQLEGSKYFAQIAGFDDNMSLVHQPKLLNGRTILRSEFEQGSLVCLIDERLSETMGGNVIGKHLFVANRGFRVIGVVKNLAPQTMTTGSGMLLMPLNIFLDTFGGDVAEITISVQTGQNTAQVADCVRNTLGEGGFRTDTLEDEINAAREIVHIFVMVLLCVATVCMVCGAIGVSNVLLLSVRERQSEIGLLKALGGTSKQLGILFLLESVIYAVTGGVLGCGLSFLTSWLLSNLIGLDARMHADSMLFVLFAAMVLGILSGVAPAITASRLQPVRALYCE